MENNTVTACLILLLFFPLSRSGEVFVETEHGVIEGESLGAKPGPNSRTVQVNTFLGVPYAKSPTGNLRWKPPVKPERYRGVLDATRLGPVCPQGGLILLISHPFWDRFSEDCLHLNVFAPNTSGSYPVLFFIHGGAYTGSGNIQYPGHYLAAKDTVVVVANYRLGSLGFLTTQDSAAPGNYGLLDQHLALQWVHTNIRAFGGDPGRITLIGQSAGASSVGLHMVSPKSQGLFHQAILASGTDVTPWAINFPEMNPREFTAATAKNLNCTRRTNQEMLDCMRQVDYDTLLDNEEMWIPPGYITLGFVPTVDNDFLPDEPEKLRAQGKFSKVKTISGVTSEEGSLFALALVPGLLEGGLDRAEYVEELRFWTKHLMPEFPEVAFTASDFEYTHWPHTNDPKLNRKSFVEIFTDLAFGAGLEKFLNSQAPHSPAYQYIMAYSSKNAIWPEWMGVPHTGDVAIMMGSPCNLMPENDAIFEQMEMKPFSIVDWTDEDREFSEYFMTLFSNFAKYGDPTPTPVRPPFNQTEVTWLPYLHGDKTNHLYMSREGNDIRHDYNSHRIAFWNQFIPNVYEKLKKLKTTPSPQQTTPRHTTNIPSSAKTTAQLSINIGSIFLGIITLTNM